MPILLRRLIEKDAVHGYGLVLHLIKIDQISAVILAPMNIMTKNTINEHGRIVEKNRLTHNQSYKWVSETLVNSRVDKDNLLPCRFGACLKCSMNWTVAAKTYFKERKLYPQN